jgi:cytochrome c553
MNLISTTLSLQMAPLALLVLVTPSPAQSAETATVSQHDLQAKIIYCKTCHGLEAEGYRGAGAGPMPRLAGQQSEYLENQLQAFVDGRRKNKYMFDVAKVLSPAMRSALARHFENLNPKPIGGASMELAGAGKKIYEQGIPESNIPPCFSCHGADAEGTIGGPRLAGQLYDFTFKTLINWSKERGQDPDNPDTSATMKPIAGSLTENQILAVAAYVSELTPPKKNILEALRPNN